MAKVTRYSVIRKTDKDFQKILNVALQDLTKEIQKNISSRMSVDKAVSTAIADIDYPVIIKNAIADQSVEIMRVASDGNKDALVSRRWVLGNKWQDDKLTLSGKVNDLSRMDEVKAALKIGMNNRRSWIGTAEEISKRDLTKGDTPKYLDELITSARKVYKGNYSDYQQYKLNVTRAMGRVDKLAQNGAPTSRLKAAYQAVIDTTEAASREEFEKAVKYAVQAKARYNAERLARTERARAYAEGTYQEAWDNPDVIGIQYELNDGHPRRDICDVHCGIDLFGLGAGCYPLDHLPVYPFHPNCICQMSYIYGEDEIKKRPDYSNAIGFIDGLSDNGLESIFGVGGAEKVAKNPGKWRDYLSGWQGLKNISDLIKI
jgi:hypothetical protein